MQGLDIGQGLGRTGEEDAIGDPHLVALGKEPLLQAFDDELNVIRDRSTPTGLRSPRESWHRQRQPGDTGGDPEAPE
ncbi:hypothetical protein [Streptomyces asiaticus]|uniref:hypothetical protein n=1 Tax=Streptomyces asiaticus TaxID=114695 RepID=UPI0038023143